MRRRGFARTDAHALDESLALLQRYHGASERYASASRSPRGSRSRARGSCSRKWRRRRVGRRARPHARVRDSRTKCDGAREQPGGEHLEYFDAVGLVSPRLNVGALRLGRRRTSRSCWRSATSRSRTAPAPTSSSAPASHPFPEMRAPRHLRLARRRRRRLQQPPRHVRRDAARGDAPGDARSPGCALGARRAVDGDAGRCPRARAGGRNRLDRGREEGRPHLCDAMRRKWPRPRPLLPSSTRPAARTSG